MGSRASARPPPTPDALGKADDAEKLRDATKEIYGGDEYMNQLSETVNADAEDA